jgi:hypothetical protein
MRLVPEFSDKGNDKKFTQKCNNFKGILYAEAGPPISVLEQEIQTLKRSGGNKPVST